MAPPPIEVEVRAGRAADHDDLLTVIRNLESVGGVRLSDSGEIVHALGWTGARRARNGALPWVLTPPRLDPLPDADESALLLAADAVVVRTSQQRDAAHLAGVPWFRLFVVPVTVDATVFHRSGPAARSTDRVRLVAESTGGADGISTLLSAVAAWEAAEVVVIAAKRGVALRSEARRKGLAARFLVVEPRDEAERAWWIRSAHAAVAVPRAGLPPRLALEAMACGVPLVATPVDLLEDLIVHGVTGLHVPVGDALSLGRAVRSLVSDPFQLEAFGMAAADRALNRYSLDRVGRDLVAVYRRVLAGQPISEESDDVADDPEGGAAAVDQPTELDGVIG